MAVAQTKLFENKFVNPRAYVKTPKNSRYARLLNITVNSSNLSLEPACIWKEVD